MAIHPDKNKRMRISTKQKLNRERERFSQITATHQLKM